MLSAHIRTGDRSTPQPNIYVVHIQPCSLLSLQGTQTLHLLRLAAPTMIIYLSLTGLIPCAAFWLSAPLSSLKFGFLLSFIFLLWLFGGRRGRCGWGSSVWSRFGRLGKQVRPLSERRLRKGACWVSWAPDWGSSLSGRAWAQQGEAFQLELW